jgi:glycosidase
MNEKIVIYQILTRLYGNRNTTRKENGTIEENGCGKMNDLTPAVLKRIRGLGMTHVWFTGIIRYATHTDYSAFGIPRQHPAVVKGRAGSPYAITDYFDVDPDLAVNVEQRMEEFQLLVNRAHKAGLKVVIDFVPNHVARQYKSICRPQNVKPTRAIFTGAISCIKSANQRKGRNELRTSSL